MKKILDWFSHIKSRTQVDENGCWLWQGSINGAGYGGIGFKPYTVHKYMWEHVHGKVMNDLFVCHTCDVRHCCNPEHLFLGTNMDNLIDAAEKGRRKKGITKGGIKLNKREALEIKSEQRSRTEIAKDYGISVSQVSKIRSGLAWDCLVDRL